jgi:hypothetical protein
MQRNTLPRIEYLHITLEQLRCFSHLCRCDLHKDLTCSTLCPKDFNLKQADMTYLRTLHLQQTSIGDIIVLIQNLTSMSQVVSLILVNCSAKGMYRY